jgi:hypothetical protein
MCLSSREVCPDRTFSSGEVALETSVQLSIIDAVDIIDSDRHLKDFISCIVSYFLNLVTTVWRDLRLRAEMTNSRYEGCEFV